MVKIIDNLSKEYMEEFKNNLNKHVTKDFLIKFYDEIQKQYSKVREGK